jgi:hypothetical protein
MYSPKIAERLIPQLYRLKQTTKKPMTKMVNEAVIEYLEKRKEMKEDEQQLPTTVGSYHPDIKQSY